MRCKCDAVVGCVSIGLMRWLTQIGLRRMVGLGRERETCKAWAWGSEPECLGSLIASEQVAQAFEGLLPAWPLLSAQAWGHAELCPERYPFLEACGAYRCLAWLPRYVGSVALDRV